MYDESFWIDENVGNNAISYEKRCEISTKPKLFVPELISGNINDVKIGPEIVFEEMDNYGKLKSFCGLEKLVQMDFEGKRIYVMDNHNHALFFWAKELGRQREIDSSVPQNDRKGISVVHVDQHSDMNKPGGMEILDKNMDLKQIFDYTNFVCNVGNFIVPAQELGLIDKVYQVRTEYSLLNFVVPEEEFILDIDLDFWVDEMGILEFEKTIDVVKKLLVKAKFVTIATSPYFFEQNRALEVLGKILK